MSEQSREEENAVRKALGLKALVDSCFGLRKQRWTHNDIQIATRFVTESAPLLPLSELEDKMVGYDTMKQLLYIYKRAAGKGLQEGLKASTTSIDVVVGYFARNGPGSPYMSALAVCREYALTDSVDLEHYSEKIDCLDTILERMDKDEFPINDRIEMASSAQRILSYIELGTSRKFRIELAKIERLVSLLESLKNEDPSFVTELFRLGCNMLVFVENNAWLQIKLIDALFAVPNRETQVKVVRNLNASIQIDQNVLLHRVVQHALELGCEEQLDDFLLLVAPLLLSPSKGLDKNWFLKQDKLLDLIFESAAKPTLGGARCIEVILVASLSDCERPNRFSEMEGQLVDLFAKAFSSPDIVLPLNTQYSNNKDVWQYYSNNKDVWYSCALAISQYQTIPAHVHDLIRFFVTQVCRSELPVAYRVQVFNILHAWLPSGDKPGIMDDKERAIFVNNVIWLHDPTRSNMYLRAQLHAVRSLVGQNVDVRFVLLMTWLRAPAVIPRLRDGSALRVLPADLLRLLAAMLRTVPKSFVRNM